MFYTLRETFQPLLKILGCLSIRNCQHKLILFFGCTGSLSSCGEGASRGSLLQLQCAERELQSTWAQLPCGMWNLSFPNKDRTCVFCIARQILNQWVTREVPWGLIIVSDSVSYWVIAVFPNKEQLCLPGNIWQCLETFFIVSILIRVKGTVSSLWLEMRNAVIVYATALIQ